MVLEFFCQGLTVGSSQESLTSLTKVVCTQFNGDDKLPGKLKTSMNISSILVDLKTRPWSAGG